MKEYKSPVSSLLWSITMSGFGQFYNGQYVFGALLFSVELLTNALSGINSSILFSFTGNLEGSQSIFNMEWGLFYPSAYLFSIWQAYNKAIVINHHHDGEDPPRETYLTGFFFGSVIGMNLGVYWHPDLMFGLEFFSSPIFSGLVLGIITGFIVHIIEHFWKKGRT